MFAKRNIIFLCLLILGVLLITGCQQAPSNLILTYIGPIVTYDGNTNTGGTVPVDSSSPYAYEATVTVLGEGDLVKDQDGISLLFTGWNTQADGSGTSYNEADTFNIGSEDVTLFAQWSVLRGTGPAGGLIFYDKGYVSLGWRYLEAAPSDQSGSTAWSNVTDVAVGTYAQGIVIGSGQTSTTAIIAQSGHTESAAKLCDDLSIENNSIIYDDWFLPSKDELNLMYTNLEVAGVGGFSGFNSYWSSSENSVTTAWRQNFNFGPQYYFYKGSSGRVRAVRAF